MVSKELSVPHDLSLVNNAADNAEGKGGKVTLKFQHRHTSAVVCLTWLTMGGLCHCRPGELMCAGLLMV